MNNASLELGGTNWAEKDGNILGYSVGDTSGNYSPQEFTFARGSNLSATRIDRAGLIVKGRENVLLQSNQFDTTWGASSTITITSGQSGYDGTNDAWKIESDGSSGFNQINQAVSHSGVNTFSVYAKAGTNTAFSLRSLSATDARANFDLSAGSVSTSGTIDASIVSVGGDWYRCSVVFNGSNTNVYVYPNYIGAASAGFIYIQDAQLEQGLAASPYIPTTTTTAQAGVLENTPRLNYTTGVANPYLLLEPSRTNIITNSEYLGGSDWIKSGNGTGSVPVITSNAAISPEGVQNATRVDLDLNGGTSSGDWSWVYQNFTSTGNDETFSMYIKAVDASNVGKVIAFGAVSFTAQSLTADWVRIESTSSAAVGGYGNGFRLRGTEGTSNTASFYVFGIQHEQNASYPTSYIPTYSVSATRAQDNCSKTNASGEIGQTEGVLYAEVAALANDGTYRNIALSDGSLTNRILIQYTPNANQINIVIIFSGGQYSLNHTVSNVTEFNKIAIKYKAGDNALWINGFEVDTDTNTLLPSALNTLSFDNTIGDAFYSKTKALVLYKEALTDTQLATLTTI